MLDNVLTAAVAIVIITVVGGIALFVSVIGGWIPPSWSYAQYLLAAFASGLVVIVNDLLVASDRTDDPLWKRTLRLSIVIAFNLAILGIAVWWEWKDLGAS
jgi:hypothetical protein